MHKKWHRWLFWTCLGFVLSGAISGLVVMTTYLIKVESAQWKAYGIPKSPYLEIDNHRVVNGFKKVNRSIKEIEIPEGVVGIDDDSFYKCDFLKKVKLPSTLQWIGRRAFSACNNLTSINFPSELTKIDSQAFGGCDGFKNINLPSGLIELGNSAFAHCTNLENVQFNHKLKRIGYAAFGDCFKLTQLVLPENLEEIGGRAFLNCSGLTNVKIPASVTHIGIGLFDGCQLSSENVINNSPVLFEWWAKNHPYAQGTISSIVNASKTMVDLTQFLNSNGQLFTVIGAGVFTSCAELRSLTLPDYIVKVDDSAFENCQNLTEVNFSQHLQQIGHNAFAHCIGLRKINLPNSLQSFGSNVFLGCINLKEIVFAKNSHPTSILDNSFDGIVNVTFHVKDYCLVKLLSEKVNSSHTIILDDY